MTPEGDPAVSVLVTGASGFVGGRVCRTLADAGYDVIAAVRGDAGAARVGPAHRVVRHGDLTDAFPWEDALRGVHAVVHAAARVHVLRDTAADPLAAFTAANAEATERLARAAERAGVRRFVYISSIKVLGEGKSTPYREGDEPRPADPYGVSKLDGERRLNRVARETGLEVVVVRPPLVYGPGVAGNFRRILRLVELARRLPLPLGGARNRRTLVYVDNLAAAVAACVAHPRAGGETFLVGDDDDLSTAELLTRIAALMGHQARLVAVPRAVIETLACVTGRGSDVERLFGTLQVDSSHIRRTLDWTASVSVDDALRKTVAWFRARPGRAWAR